MSGVGEGVCWRMGRGRSASDPKRRGSPQSNGFERGGRMFLRWGGPALGGLIDDFWLMIVDF